MNWLATETMSARPRTSATVSSVIPTSGHRRAARGAGGHGGKVPAPCDTHPGTSRVGAGACALRGGVLGGELVVGRGVEDRGAALVLEHGQVLGPLPRQVAGAVV